MPLVLICRMHPNICVESFCFFCTLLLRLDVPFFNSKFYLFISRFQLLDLYVPPPVSLVSIKNVGSMDLS